MVNPNLKTVARESAIRLLSAGALKKKWTPHQRDQWTKAFNALQRLAGKKMIIRDGKLTTEHRLGGGTGPY